MPAALVRNASATLTDALDPTTHEPLKQPIPPAVMATPVGVLAAAVISAPISRQTKQLLVSSIITVALLGFPLLFLVDDLMRTRTQIAERLLTWSSGYLPAQSAFIFFGCGWLAAQYRVRTEVLVLGLMLFACRYAYVATVLSQGLLPALGVSCTVVPIAIGYTVRDSMMSAREA